MTNDRCNKNLKLLWVLTLCVNMVFFLPVILPFYKEHIGLSFHDFLIGESVFAAGMILFDVPTGWVADRFGRKYSMMAGAAWYIICLYLLMTATSLLDTIIAQGAISLAISLISGANSAFLYDTLLVAGREAEYQKREGFRFGLQLYGASFACVTGGYLYALSPTLPFVVEMGFMALAMLCALLMHEPERHKVVERHHPLKEMKDTLVYVLAGHRDIAVMIALSVLLFSTTKICMWSIQAYMTALHYPTSYNGWIIAGVMLVGALSGHFSHRILPRVTGAGALYTMLGLIIVVMGIAGLAITPLGLALLGLEGFAYGFAAPRVQTAINQMVDSSRRATVLSSANFAASLGFIPFSQFVGLMNDHEGISVALLSHAGLLTTLALLCAGAIERKRITGYIAAL